jgi:hypothetical protein
MLDSTAIKLSALLSGQVVKITDMEISINLHTPHPGLIITIPAPEATKPGTLPAIWLCRERVQLK